LRARIVEGGTIRVGDAISLVPSGRGHEATAGARGQVAQVSSVHAASSGTAPTGASTSDG
jgi:hypothetical protein